MGWVTRQPSFDPRARRKLNHKLWGWVRARGVEGKLQPANAILGVPVRTPA
jgi:hypothetical protein